MGKIFTVLSLFSYFFASSLCGLASEASIRLVDTIAVQAPNITLGEIASIESDNPYLKQQLFDLHIADAPRIGSPKVISSYALQSILKDEGFDNVEIFGTQSTTYTETYTVPKEELQEKIISWIQREMLSDVEPEVRFKKLPHKWKIPKGSNTSIQISGNRDKLSGTTTLTLRAMADGRVYATGHARMDIKLFKTSAVLIRPLKRQEKLESTDVEFRRAEITKSNGMEIQDINNAIGLVAKKNLPVGSVLTTTDFEQAVVIERGTPNRIVVINGTVKLGIAGAIALQNGREGENIMFSNPMNEKETLRATVKGPGLAVMKLR